MIALRSLIAALLAAPALACFAQQPAAGNAVATFAGGCFWCMEPPYDALPGAMSTPSGYMTGSKSRSSGSVQVSPSGRGTAARVDALVGQGAHVKPCAQRTAEVDQPSPQPPEAEGTHPPPLVGYNAWSRDPILAEAVEREGGG